jgi:hypothetical protein
LDSIQPYSIRLMDPTKFCNIHFASVFPNFKNFEKGFKRIINNFTFNIIKFLCLCIKLYIIVNSNALKKNSRK